MRTTLNNSSLFDIITVVVFALSPFVYSRDNDAVQKLNGSRQVDCKCIEIVLSQCPRKNDLCCFGCVISSLLHGVVNWLVFFTFH